MSEQTRPTSASREEIAQHLNRIEKALTITFKDKTTDQARVAGVDAVRAARGDLLGVDPDA